MDLERVPPRPARTAIGSGGYNAALIAEIVGPVGLAVTVDIDRLIP